MDNRYKHSILPNGKKKCLRVEILLRHLACYYQGLQEVGKRVAEVAAPLTPLMEKVIRLQVAMKPHYFANEAALLCQRTIGAFFEEPK